MNTNDTPAGGPQPRYDDSIDFLRRWRPGGPWLLTAIGLDKTGIDTRAFRAEQEGELRAWLEAQGAHRNIYFSVNPTFPAYIDRAAADGRSKKTEATDIEAMVCLHVDLDPREGEDVAAEQRRIRERLTTNLPAGVPPPTLVVFSGGGCQGFWALREPVRLDGSKAAAEGAKRWNLQLEVVFGADHCHNIDRIMRLPGTVNWPDSKKKAKGRTAALAEVVVWHPERAYDIGQFTKAPEVQAAAKSAKRPEVDTAGVRRFGGDVDRIPTAPDRKISDRGRVVIVQGRDPDEPHKFGSSRSEWLYFACCEMVRAGVSDADIYSVITDPDFGISASVLDKGSATEKYALKQVADARAEVAEAAEEFSVTDSGAIPPTQRNTKLAIRRLGVGIAYDLFRNRTMVRGLEGFGPELSDMAVDRLWLTIDQRFGFRPSFEFFEKVVKDAAWDARFNPVTDYLAGLAWDGRERVPTWLVEYAGAEDTPFNRAVGRLVLVAAVRRARRPGCKFDEMLVLESPQGSYKSTALRNLVPAPDLFTDSLSLSASVKEQMEQLDGKWIVEAGELQGMRKAEVEKCKSFLSRQDDEARLAYGRRASRQPRQCVIIGTTNNKEYLQDLTGNRRFWPVRVGTFRADDVLRDRDQLWAEAAHLEAQGESIRLDPSLWGAAAEQQRARLDTGPFFEILQPLLDGKSGKVSAESIWRVVGYADKSRRTAAARSLIGSVMRQLGWSYSNRRFRGEKAWGYARDELASDGPFVEYEASPDGSSLVVAQPSPGDSAPAPDPEIPF